MCNKAFMLCLHLVLDVTNIGFTHSFADPDVWINDSGNVWEYVW